MFTLNPAVGSASDRRNASATKTGGMANAGFLGRARSAALALVALVATGAAAQEVTLVAYRDTNLAQFGVPNFEAMEPIGTKRFDKVASIPGEETLQQAYRVGQGFVATYSIRGRIYAVAYDTDGERPVDYLFQDNEGSGNFVPISTTAESVPPDWVSQ